MRPLHGVLVAVICLAAAVAGYNLARMLHVTPGSAAPPSAPEPAAAEELIGRPRPAFTLPDLDNRPRSIGEWDGRALLINFWATWCAPCREEIPAFQTVRKRYPREQFEVIGVALDLPGMVAEFQQELGIEYPLLYGRQDADEVMRRYGNKHGTLPYSVFVDARGIVRHIHARGVLEEAELTAILEKIVPEEGDGAAQVAK